MIDGGCSCVPPRRIEGLEVTMFCRPAGLKKHNVPSQFVRYPRESHGIREPQHTMDWLHRHIAWFDKHIKGKEPCKL